MPTTEGMTVKVKKGPVVINSVALAEFLRSPDGPLARRMIILADAVKEETIRSMGDGFAASFLGPRIVKRITAATNGPHIIIGSDQTTTRPHPIEGNPFLAFQWEKIGQFVVVRSVNHPGSEFAPYLLKKLTEAAIAVGRGHI